MDMLKKTSVFLVVVVLLSVLCCGRSFAQEYKMYLKLTEPKDTSNLVALDGSRSYKVKVRFVPLSSLQGEDANATLRVAVGDYPAFMSLATQVCRGVPGALNINADKDARSVEILYVTSSRNDWINALVNELSVKLKEGRGINIVGWDLNRKQPVF
jgi:hypothetical protein